MIRYLQIENFKSLKMTAIPFEKLNLFFGMNGMGKSSVIQSLLLLRQSYWSRQVKGLHALNINGDLINLGSSIDILCHYADEDVIRFYLTFSEDNVVDVSYAYADGYLPTGVLEIRDISKADIPFAEKEALFEKGFYYLGAEHIGPRDEYSSSKWNVKGMNPLGNQGEYAVPYLAREGDRYHVPQELCLPEGKTDRLFDQVSAWMSKLSPGVKISAREFPSEQRAKLDISYEDSFLVSPPFLPVNVGFGIPYVLPLVIALLTADKRGLLLLENPESHLHPKGQTAMAELIAKVANYGTQIICESHSDHIINGIRVAVKKGQLKSQDLSVIYFEKDKNQMTNTMKIAVDDKGNLSDYPSGLLDEWGILMAELM